MAAPLLPIILLGGAALVLAAKAKANNESKAKQPNTYTLDLNLPPQLRDQVLSALATEQSAEKLEAFAAAIGNEYPLAAASLRLKASMFKFYASAPPVGPGGFGTLGTVSQPAMKLPKAPMMPQRPIEYPSVPSTTQQPVMAPIATPPPFVPPSAPTASTIQTPAIPAVSIQTPMGSIQTPAIPSMSIPTASMPPAVPTAVPQILGGLDPGMPIEMQKAIAGALTTESDPEKLEGFASAIQSQYPVAAGLLKAKAATLRLAKVPASGPDPGVVVLPGMVVTPQTLGGTYKVLEGDYAIKIAKKFTGEENRWKELIKANPKKKKAKDGNFASLYPGEILNLPPEWPSTQKGGL